jgi:hypothetical protein
VPESSAGSDDVPGSRNGPGTANEQDASTSSWHSVHGVVRSQTLSYQPVVLRRHSGGIESFSAVRVSATPVWRSAGNRG